MELHVIEREGREAVVLLDNEMRIVKPVYDYLKFQRQKDKTLNTLKASGSDLRTYWEFLEQLTYRAAYDKLKKVQEEIGVDFNFHDLRHTFCSNLVQSGMDVSVVRMIMGHKHLSTTQKYTHLSNPYIEDSLSRYWNQSTLIGGSSDGR